MKTVVKKKRAKPKKVVKRRTSKEVDEIPDLSNDPYFVKKAEETKAWLKTTGIVFDEE